jgi:peptidylprolyl isomerase/peptidyl-prolyl cis-trans isomerase D
MLKDQFLDLEKTNHSLQELGSKLGQSPIEADSLSFSSPQVNKTISDPNVVGASFGVKLNTISKPIIGDRGVYVLEALNRFTVPGPSLHAEQDQAILSRKGMAQNEAMEALKKLANVVDNRAKFF